MATRPAPARKAPAKTAAAKKPAAAPRTSKSAATASKAMAAASVITLKAVFEQLGEAHALPKKQAQGLLADFVAAMTTHLKQGNRIRMRGFGILEVKTRAARIHKPYAYPVVGQGQDNSRVLTLDIKPRSREAVKPAELIQVSGHHELTLNARRAITILWHNARFQGVAEDRDYTIEINDLKPDGHKGYEMVVEAIEALMRTILTLRLPDGKTRRVQFLGGNDLDSEDRPAGVLTYSFDKRLFAVLKDATIWGKIVLPVLMAFISKYAISLYENLAQFASLSLETSQDYTLEAFRELMGVPPGRYKTFGELNRHVIKPAVEEVNALAPFWISILPVKQGKRVVQIKVDWWTKDNSQLGQTYDELQRSEIGRRASISGNVEYVSDPLPSLSRIARNQTCLVPYPTSAYPNSS